MQLQRGEQGCGEDGEEPSVQFPVLGRSAPTLGVAMSLHPPIDRVAARFVTWVV